MRPEPTLPQRALEEVRRILTAAARRLLATQAGQPDADEDEIERQRVKR
jgi:hypothetical protein